MKQNKFLNLVMFLKLEAIVLNRTFSNANFMKVNFVNIIRLKK